jgi:hypothetical protein
MFLSHAMYIFKGNNFSNYIYYCKFILTFFYFKYNFRNVHNKPFSNDIKRKMLFLLKATSKEELEEIFSDIEKSEENGVKGILLIFFYFYYKLNS